ncbi:UNVERIFIED_CONTAM: hypothetical protein GTU68_041725 [Idotea baltica]|nr:hypothetical protein [Idotea baltica]
MILELVCTRLRARLWCFRPETRDNLSTGRNLRELPVLLKLWASPMQKTNHPVDRDDLKDMGSIIWAETVKAIRRMNPSTTLETLIPDFQGIERHLDRIIEVAHEVVSHNMETVRRLTREVRIQAKYDRSLGVLKYLRDNGINRTKSGIMLGLGEREEEVITTMEDLRKANVDVVTIGQYLQPSKKHLPVKEFILPEQFKKYETIGLEMGFRHVESGALVRSSYKAHKHIH